MKIRIRGNSVRYRLSKSEVTKLAMEGWLEEKTEFGNNTLSYSITPTDKETMSADFDHNNITLYIPQAALQQWADTNQIGIDYNMPLPNGGSLYLLLEKDFKCNDAAITEDQGDYFENPQLTC